MAVEDIVQTAIDTDELVTVERAAAIAGLTPQRIRQLLGDGSLLCVRAGSHSRLIPGEAVRALADRR